MKSKLVIFAIVATLFAAQHAYANSAGYDLADAYIELAGSLQQELVNFQKVKLDSAESPTESLSSWIKHSEIMIRIVNSGYADLEKLKARKYYSEKINGLIGSLQNILLKLKDTYTSDKKQVSAMMLPTIQSNVQTLEKQLSEFMIKSSEDSVTVDESYRMILYFVPVLMHALVKEENGIMVPDVDPEQVDSLKDKVLFYYGDDVKKGPVEGQKHIIATGGMLWRGLSNLEN